jgi:hypothetical protein
VAADEAVLNIVLKKKSQKSPFKHLKALSIVQHWVNHEAIISKYLVVFKLALALFGFQAGYM